MADGEDLVLSVLDNLYTGLKEGRFEELNDRHDLWMVRWKVNKHLRFLAAEKRGGDALLLC
ncbi:MAG: ECF-type sigma factor [Gemmataceae bacterium]